MQASPSGCGPGRAAAGTGARTQRQWVLGVAEDHGGVRRPMRADTVFDLASLTKVLVTAPAVLLLAQRGLLDLDDRAATTCPASTNGSGSGSC